MKKQRNLSIAMALVTSMAFFACKDKNATDMDDTSDTIGMPADNTTVEPAPPPVVDTVPGVESGGNEQIP